MLQKKKSAPAPEKKDTPTDAATAATATTAAAGAAAAGAADSEQRGLDSSMDQSFENVDEDFEVEEGDGTLVPACGLALAFF